MQKMVNVVIECPLDKMEVSLWVGTVSQNGFQKKFGLKPKTIAAHCTVVLPAFLIICDIFIL